MWTGNIERIPLEYIARNATAIVKSSPVPYIRDAKVRGALFGISNADDMVSAVDTRFFIDHDEPKEVLGNIKEVCTWPLGDIHEGHEFLLVIENKRFSRWK